MMRRNVRLAVLTICSFFASIAPLAVAVGFNFKAYTATPAGAYSLGVGGVLALVIFFLKAINRLPKNVKRVFRYGAAFALVCLLEPLIMDAKLLLGMAFLGELIDCLIFAPLIARERGRKSRELVRAAVREGLAENGGESGRT